MVAVNSAYARFLPAEALAAIFGVACPLPNFPPSWNVAPTQQQPVLRRHPQTGERRLDLLAWGLVPHFTRDLKAARKPINARAETVATSGMFRGALAQRRCLVPADAFYEWRAMQDGKQPYAIARRAGSRWRSPGCGKAGGGQMATCCGPSPSSPRRRTRPWHSCTSACR